MLYRQIFLAENRPIGETLRQPVFIHGQLSLPTSYLFYCQKCGEVFAKAPVVKPDGSTTKWQALATCCQKCVPSYSAIVPGSITVPWDEEYEKALPQEVLLRELALHIANYERNHP